MMGRQASHPPMNYGDMVEQGKTERASRVFSVKNRDANDERIAGIVSAGLEQLEAASRVIDTISLNDTKIVKDRTMLYTRACSDAGTLPTFSGLLRSMGMTAAAGYSFITRHDGHPTATWLEMYRDFCGDLLADAALQGATHPVFSIFVEKSRNLWRDSITIETVPQYPLGNQQDPEEIASKYRAEMFAALPED